MADCLVLFIFYNTSLYIHLFIHIYSVRKDHCRLDYSIKLSSEISA